MISHNFLTRRVRVNRNRSPYEAIDATNRKLYLDRKVVVSMPRGGGDEVEVFFFKPGRYLTDADLSREYKLHELIPVDPYSLAAVNEADSAFAFTRPNATHWKDGDGKWCYIAFLSASPELEDERRVVASSDNVVWSDDYWFAGVKK